MLRQRAAGHVSQERVRDSSSSNSQCRPECAVALCPARDTPLAEGRVFNAFLKSLLSALCLWGGVRGKREDVAEGRWVRDQSFDQKDVPS